MWSPVDVPCLRFQPRSLVEWGEHRGIAWPAWCWTAIASVGQAPPDPIERAVLALAEAGVDSMPDLERLLGRRASRGSGLSEQLIRHVRQGLVGAGWLTAGGAITESGRAWLNEAERNSADLEVRRIHVFQDPFGGDMWPVERERLDVAELVEGDSEAWVKVALGSRGKPRLESHRVVAAPRVTPDAPSEPTLMRALREAAARQRAGGVAGPASVGARLRAVRVVGDPRPVLLLTYLYVPRDTTTFDADWRAVDPFGLGDSSFLRARIADRVADDRAVADVVRALVGEAADEAVRERQRWRDVLEAEARRRVEHVLSAGAASLAVYPDLLAMEQARLEQEDASRHQRRHDAETRTGRLMAQIVLERTFQRVLRRFPCPPEALDAVTRTDKSHNQRLFDRIAARLGADAPLPPTLSRSVRGKLVPAATRGEASLRPLALSALLAADARRDHPLRALLSRAPDALARLDALATARDRVSHASRHEACDAPLSDVFDTVYLFVGNWMPLLEAA